MNNNKFKISILIALLTITLISWRCGLKAKDSDAKDVVTNSAEALLNAPNPDGKEAISVEKQGFILKTIVQVIEEGHFSPRPINDAMGQKIFDEFLSKLDYGKQVFTQQDIDLWQAAIPTIDNQFRDGSTRFFEEVTSVFADRKKEVQAYYAKYIDAPMDFTLNESIQLDGKKMIWAKDSKDLEQRWRKNIKYRLLAKLNELQDAQQEKKDTVPSTVLLSTEKLLDSARISVKKNMEMYFKNVNKTTNADLFEMYANSLANLQDPHTEFYTPRSKQSFDEQMSGTFYGIGATLQMKENYCTIVSIVTGSPCYKQGSIKVDDKIVQVAQGAEEPVEVVGWDVSDIVKLIRGKKNTEVRLHIKHANGTDEIVSIIRDEIKIEETFAKSVIIQQNGKKYGFISLPEFYADFSKRNGKRCARDVQQEIIKLKSESVDGIIMDLRYNGGGSLSDVVEIGGYFLGDQPIVLVGTKDGATKALTPSSKKALYNGPLVIMANFASASASEILAGAIQDYKRGIIVGGRTFGKGTVQRPIDLDEVYSNSEFSPLGSLKLTLQKFYRVSGKSTQQKGVSADVMLPDLFMYVDRMENTNKSALNYTEVTKANYSAFKNSNIDQVIKSYNGTIKRDAYYNKIQTLAKKMNSMQDERDYSLNSVEFKKQISAIKAFNKTIDLEKELKDSLNMINLQADKAFVEADSTAIKKNIDWIKLRAKDKQIIDAVNILAAIKVKEN